MININVISGQFCEPVDELTFHLETSEGILLISVEQYTINNITFPTSSEAVFFILNF
jgi:hypothetical protein